MGKSSRSCLKIITCGGAANQPEVEDNEAPAERKASSDKRRWSFQKRTSGPRVLSNSVVSTTQTLVSDKEYTLVFNKEYLENTQKNIEPWVASPVRGQLHNEERNKEEAASQSEVVISGVYSVSLTEENMPISDKIHESVILIQAFIRRYLAQKELACRKNVVRLQAAIRGHLVRRQAIGTLRCMQAIVKMQALVRVHRARHLVGNGKSSFKFEKPPSVRVLLSNGFAHQLLTSSAKVKTISINCDPASSNSVWKWLERWMVVTFSDLFQRLDKNHIQESQVLGENSSPADTMTEHESVISNTRYSSKCYVVEDNGEENSVPKGPDSFLSGSSKSASQYPSPFFDERESGFVEGKQFMASGSRKTCNPAFIAAQAKFKELSSSQVPAKDIKNPIVDQLEEHLAQTTTDGSLIENSNSNYSRGRAATSECGTEISISSTLDSPESSETESGEIVLEIGGIDKEKFVGQSLEDETSNQLDISEAKNLAFFNVDITHPQIKEEFDDFHDSVQINEQETKTAVLIMPAHLEMPLDPRGCKSSPEGSPRSRATIQESHGTPSSQVSTNAAGSKRVGSLSIRNQRSYTTGKRSPSISNSDSSMRNSEQLSKDSRSSKRRSSFSLTNTDPTNHEPRLSSSNAVPSYMQITESARAKLPVVSISSKSTPDSNEKDQTKKRHSLPIVNGMQETSPRLQRSTSQVQQNPKARGNDSPVTSSRKRWQR